MTDVLDSDLPDTDEALDELVEALEEVLGEEQRQSPVFVGIHTGGVWVAEHVHAAMGSEEPLGTLSISFYRDDFTRLGLHPRVTPSHLPFSVDDRHVVLVDDVLHTGRTIRAALNELFDYGRPASVTLAVLIERDGRELPIQADCVGAGVELGPDEYVKLTGPDPLELVLQRKNRG